MFFTFSFEENCPQKKMSIFCQQPERSSYSGRPYSGKKHFFFFVDIALEAN
jgi:hypothetical protein